MISRIKLWSMKLVMQIGKRYLVRLRNPFTKVKAEHIVICQWYFLMEEKYRLELEDRSTGIYLNSEIEVLREVKP